MTKLIFKYRNNPESYLENDGFWRYKEPVVYEKMQRLSVEDTFNCMKKYSKKYFSQLKNMKFGAYIVDILFMEDEPVDILSWKCWEDIISDYLENNEIKNPELSVVSAYKATASFIYNYFDNKYNDYSFSKMILEIEKMYNNKNKDKVFSLFKKNIVKYENLEET